MGTSYDTVDEKLVVATSHDITTKPSIARLHTSLCLQVMIDKTDLDTHNLAMPRWPMTDAYRQHQYTRNLGLLCKQCAIQAMCYL